MEGAYPNEDARRQFFIRAVRTLRATLRLARRTAFFFAGLAAAGFTGVGAAAFAA